MLLANVSIQHRTGQFFILSFCSTCVGAWYCGHLEGILHSKYVMFHIRCIWLSPTEARTCFGMALWKAGKKEMFYLTMYSTHFIYGFIASDIWWRTAQLTREETRRCHMGYYFQLAGKCSSFIPQWNTAWGKKRSSMVHEGSIQWPITPMNKRSYHGAISHS